MKNERLRLAQRVLWLAALSGGCSPACSAEHDEHDDHAGTPPRHSERPEPASDKGVLRVERGMLRDLRITVREAELRPAGDAVNALGELRCDEDRYAEVGSPIAARVLRLSVAPGAQVSAGQALAELESPELGRARAELLSAEARQLQADSALGRRRGLAAERIVTARELEGSEAEAAAAAAQRTAAAESLRALGGSRGAGTRFVLRAPLAGTVLERSAVRGRVLSPEQTLFVIGDLTRLWLVAHAFERDALRIRTGQLATASFPALPGQGFSGAVRRIGSRVDPASRTVEIRIEIDNQAGSLRPGMSASARIPVGDDAQPIVTVPVAALQRLSEGWCVFLPLAEEGTFESRAVGRGRDLAGEVEIVQGLRAGERVVVDGAFLLKAEVEKARGSGAEHHHH